MTLATHAAAGAALSLLVPAQPAAAFLLGFASHFALDALPHWDYPLRSAVEDQNNPLATDLRWGRDFFWDLLKIVSDGLLGLGLAGLVIWWSSENAALGALAGAAGAMAPDFLQFVYFKLRWRWLARLQLFHLWIHTKYKLNPRGLVGPLLQVGLVVAIMLFVYYS